MVDYELGRVLACQGNVDGAREQFELVLSGKALEVGASGKKVSPSAFTIKKLALMDVIAG